ncbi:ketopantoate reductase family protein [Subtercola lobariae]|uniref:Ketopantoate reductase N-terminal domain-containing protein n=1 Tax=Subtercola lobariae TaxID=1588641 RepID=A0A917BC25_9MICO|nr:ketopantoate reductase family protein [Subtercola lobariae]GGF34273.1 hypothetical protein GCM10011399_29310 [Subtercola lobariae]
MKVLVYGAGILGSLYSARLHEAGHEVSLVARGARLAALREHGVQLAEGESTVIRSVAVPVTERAMGRYDVTLVIVRSHHVEGVLESIADLSRGDGDSGDVLFLLNWAGGLQPLAAKIGAERVLLGFANAGGTMHEDVVRYRPSTPLTRFVAMPIGEPGGGTTERVERVVQLFRSVGFRAKPERQMDAWLKTHAAFEVPLSQAVHEAGGLEALARHPDALRSMIKQMRLTLTGLASRPVPRAFSALIVVPEWMLVRVFRRFLRSSAASPLASTSPAVFAEVEFLAEQLRASAGRAS